MDEGAILAAIRQHVEVSDYEMDEEHVSEHMAAGDFDEDDIVTAVMRGNIIEQRPKDNRWLICGNVPSLRSLPGVRGRWLHVSVQYTEETGTAIVTAYRPDIGEWETERTRR